MRTAITLALAVSLVTPGCNNSGSKLSFKVQSLGAVLADPTRERIYVSDPVDGLLLAISSRTGAIEFQRPFSASIGGLALDCCGDQLFMAIPGNGRIAILDPDDFTDQGRIDLGRRAFDLAMHELGLLAITRGGLMLIDVGTKKHRVLLEDVTDTDQLLVAHSTGLVYLGTNELGETNLTALQFTASGDLEPIATQVLPGELVSFSMSFDDSEIFVGTGSTTGVSILDAQTLEVHRNLPTASPLRAFAVNASGTRAYVNEGQLTVQSYNLLDFGEGRTVVTSALVHNDGLTLTGDQAQLCAILESDDVELHPLFGAELQGSAAVHLHQNYPFVVRGKPDEVVYLLVSALPGYIFLDPPTSVDPRFLDLGLDGLRVLFAFQLDATGVQNFDFILDDEGAAGARLIVQAVTVDLSVLEVDDVSNPFVAEILPPECSQ